MIAQQLVKLLAARGETISCAESLTGGLLCDAVVQVPGASKCFMGGIVAYDEGRKVSLLGVPVSTLDFPRQVMPVQMATMSDSYGSVMQARMVLIRANAISMAVVKRSVGKLYRLLWLFLQKNCFNKEEKKYGEKIRRKERYKTGSTG